MCGTLPAWNVFSGWLVHFSTRDAEFLAGVKSQQPLVARMFLIEAGLPHQFPLCIDSTATINGTKIDQIHRDSRQAAITYAVLRGAVREAFCTCLYTKTESLLADVLTKLLTT